MARPPIGEAPMTPAERKARSRELKATNTVRCAEILEGMLRRLAKGEGTAEEREQTLLRGLELCRQLREISEKA